MIENGKNIQYYEKAKKEVEELYGKEKIKKPVYLDHVRTSSGVRFRGYWRWI